MDAQDARRVAALAGGEAEYERALLLAAEAIRLWDGPETRRALLEVMGRSPRITSVTRTTSGNGVQQMSLRPDTPIAVVVDDALDARVIDLDRRAEVGAYTTEGDVVLDAIETEDGGIALSLMLGECEFGPWCESSALRVVGLEDPGRDATDFLPGFDAEVIDLEYSSDRSLAAAIAPLPYVDEPGNVAIWRMDAPDAPITLDLPHAGSNPGAPNWANAFGRVRFSPDGSLLYASGYGPTAVFDTRTGELVDEIEGEGILAVSPDGESVLVRDGRTAAKIIDRDAATQARVLEMPEVVVDGAFSPDGTEVVTTAGDRAWVWSALTGVVEEVLRGHSDVVLSAAFRSTGELVTAGADGALITWAMDDWSASFRDAKREGHENLIPRDERTLVYERPGGTFVGISADPGLWLDRACEIAGRTLTEQEWTDLLGDRAYAPACGG